MTDYSKDIYTTGGMRHRSQSFSASRARGDARLWDYRVSSFIATTILLLHFISKSLHIQTIKYSDIERFIYINSGHLFDFYWWWLYPRVPSCFLRMLHLAAMSTSGNVHINVESKVHFIRLAGTCSCRHRTVLQRWQSESRRKFVIVMDLICEQCNDERRAPFLFQLFILFVRRSWCNSFGNIRLCFEGCSSFLPILIHFVDAISNKLNNNLFGCDVCDVWQSRRLIRHINIATTAQSTNSPRHFATFVLCLLNLYVYSDHNVTNTNTNFPFTTQSVSSSIASLVASPSWGVALWNPMRLN